jgi:transcriptional regulator with PAS, ATPase and Fis domain
MTREAVKQRFAVIGNSPKLDLAIDIAIQVAPTEVTVLVLGENGSGKDVFARIIHSLSHRKHKPYMAINCGAIPEGTIDSELFGHEKGSFTSAYESRKGYFEEANGGILFLDEIAELPLSTQARLLRVLENGEYLRVGSSKVQKTDVRVIAATNKNLIAAIRQGKFREDLYFRLNTVTIAIPPLRERGSDLELLFRYFAHQFGERYGREPVRLTPDAIELLSTYHWPGNVRELRNFAEKLSVLTRTPELNAQQLREHLPVGESRLPIVSPFSGNGNGQPPPQPSPADAPGISSEFILQALIDLKQEVFELRRVVASLVQHQFHQQHTPTPAYPSSLPLDRYLPQVVPVVPMREVDEDDSPPKNGSDTDTLSLEMNERELIQRALRRHNHNRKRAASELGISERTLYRKIRSYDLDN